MCLNVTRLAPQSELHFSISMICLNSTKTKADFLYIPLGSEQCSWFPYGSGTLLFLGSGAVLVLD